MKLAFSTLPCLNYTAEELKKLCDKYELTGVEVRIQPDGIYQHGAGLYVTNIGSSICIKTYDEKQLEYAKKLLQDVSQNGIQAIRVFLGNFCKKFSDFRTPLDHAGIVRMLQEMCDSTSVELWVETHNEYATGKVLKQLLADVNRNNLKIIWDIIHPIEDKESYQETYELIGDRIAHVHIKDGRKHKDEEWHDYEYTPLGEGELPIREIVNLLEKNGYEGYYSLEWENPWRDELKVLQWSVDEILEKFVQFMGSIEEV